jgi:hypothetical protein
VLLSAVAGAAADARQLLLGFHLSPCAVHILTEKCSGQGLRWQHLFMPPHHTVQPVLVSAAAAPVAKNSPTQHSHPTSCCLCVQVRDADVQHVAQLGSACERLNSSTANGLHLNVTDSLVAPVVILAHARAHYLAKTVLTLHR